MLTDDFGYSIVCDGMGGAQGGQIASKLATQTIDETLGKEMDGDIFHPKQAISAAINNANANVYNMAENNQELKGMGTTTVIAIVRENMLYYGSAGDSRLYKYNKATDMVEQLTKDHTMVEFLLDRGGITREQAENHPQKHYITRAIGIEAVVDADYSEHQLHSGDALLICTDGLYNYLSPEELKKKLCDSVQIGTVRPLIDSANKNGGGDNITAVVIVPEIESK